MHDGETARLGDSITSYLVQGGSARGRLVRLDESVSTILSYHQDDPPVLQRLLAELLALTVALASGLKFDGVLTLQLQGDGPVPFAVADMSSTGDLRGHVRHTPEALAALLATTPAPTVPQLFGKGILVFTVDLAERNDRYQGVIDLSDDTLAACAESYFRQSEQLDTCLELAVAEQPGNGTQPPHWSVAVLMLQRMPLTEDTMISTTSHRLECWRRAKILMRSIKAAELLDPALTPETVLFRLFHEEELQCFPPLSVLARCRCSDEKVEHALRSIARSELEDLLQDAGKIEVTCDFCRTIRRYDDLDALYGA